MERETEAWRTARCMNLGTLKSPTHRALSPQVYLKASPFPRSYRYTLPSQAAIGAQGRDISSLRFTYAFSR